MTPEVDALRRSRLAVEAWMDSVDELRAAALAAAEQDWNDVAWHAALCALATLEVAYHLGELGRGAR